MKLSTKLHSRTGLVVSMAVVATLLAACGSGGGGVAAAPAGGGLTLTATPALGAFVDGSTVIVFDHLGKECSRGKTVGGTAAITINPTTCVAPLIVQAGIPGDLYFNEATGANQAVTGTSGVRAVLPNTTVTSFGVSALTEIAAAGLLDAAGAVNTNAAGVSARNNAIASLLTNGNVTDPLAIPRAAGKTLAGVTTQATNPYGALLAMLANLVPGKTPEAIAHDLALDLADGIWDGKYGAIVLTTPSAATFGAKMLAAEGVAKVRINLVSAPTIPFSAAYLPDSDITRAVAVTAATGGTTPINPINTAKNLFTSLRTSLVLLTNPSQTGFFDTQMLAARNDLRNSVMPKLDNTMNKISVMNSAINLMDNLKATGLPAACNPMMFYCQGIYSMTDPANALNTVVQSVNYNSKKGYYSTCTTNGHPAAQFAAGTLPAGINVTCDAQLDRHIFNVTGFTSYTFNSTVTPTATNYTYTSWTTTQTYTQGGMGMGPPISTNSAHYTGTASVIQAANGLTNSSVAVSGQLAANGVSHAYDQVAINQARTYPSGTTPVGAPAGFALARYDSTGSIASVLANGTTTGTIALLTGSSVSILENSSGAESATARNLGRSLTAIVQAKTAGTQIDGTLTGSSVACDRNGLHCSPTSLSFTGSITDLANAAVGKFFTGTLTDIRDFTAYDSTQPVTNTNRIRDNGTFSGTVTNNTVTPAAVYQLTLNEDKTVDNQNTLSLIYKDSLNNTVTVNSVVMANTPTHTFNVASGTVIGVLNRTPVTGISGGTNGLTGNLYVGGTVAAPGTPIGTITRNVINYTDGTFTSL